MELERQVCSLDLAKRLKELGANQESYFFWVQQVKEVPNLSGKLKVVPADSWIVLDRWGQAENISAFTVAELGDMLPSFVKHPQDGYLNLFSDKNDNGTWDVFLRSYKEEHTLFNDTEADARAKMLSYLIENKLITV